jgi:hypothetical protein
MHDVRSTLHRAPPPAWAPGRRTPRAAARVRRGGSARARMPCGPWAIGRWGGGRRTHSAAGTASGHCTGSGTGTGTGTGTATGPLAGGRRAVEPASPRARQPAHGRACPPLFPPHRRAPSRPRPATALRDRQTAESAAPASCAHMAGTPPGCLSQTTASTTASPPPC